MMDTFVRDLRFAARGLLRSSGFTANRSGHARRGHRYALVAARLGAVAFAATWLPARRATRVDPMLSLRSE